MENFELKPKKDHKGNNKSCLANLMWTYKYQAKKRGFVFGLAKEQFKELTKQNCWYCNQEPAQFERAGKKRGPKGAYYLYNGIDRMDNTMGYTETNCIPCCGRCNRMKNILHAEDFTIHIRKIARNLGML